MCPRRIRVVAAVAMALALSVAATRAQARRYGLAGGLTTYTVVAGDSLGAIGSRFGVDPATLAAANGVRVNAKLAVGRVLEVDHRHVVPAEAEPGLLIVNVPQRMLFFDTGDGLLAFPVAVGRSTWRTPLGPFHVVKREEHPSWEVPASIRAEALRAGHVLPAVVPPGPDNPLGDYWLGLSLGDVGIHGTNAPSSIYRVTTHGCIRVHPDDIAALYPRVALGTPGRVIYEPVLLTEDGGEVWLEAHRDVYSRDPDPRADVASQAAAAGVADRIDWTAVDAVLAARAGIARPVTRKNSRDSATLSRPETAVPANPQRIQRIRAASTWPAC